MAFGDVLDSHPAYRIVIPGSLVGAFCQSDPTEGQPSDQCLLDGTRLHRARLGNGGLEQPDGFESETGKAAHRLAAEPSPVVSGKLASLRHSQSARM